ncbi:Oidioi.mRNA.OKI2018_I69.XSR.g14992.t1.cds [Oikopleura dioica]|uniref:Oidioi.mRNA.OKI2018_I69.XSR.g14992.t1.cds n=1 Tax=Oikopleura dioica TaxID=34765 RepID=A0ABN7SFH6_OIKDI|nr:Oidioi.mRNA.OKI2018_I69.XSR.g14992.t1.cds [Oikopleura dioica]
MSRNNPPDIIAAQAKLLEVAQRQTNEEIQKKLEMLGKQVAAAQAAANYRAMAETKPTYKERMKALSNPPPSYRQSKQQSNAPYSRPAQKQPRTAKMIDQPRMTEKFEDLVGVIDELGKDVRPTYAGSKSAQERLKRGLQHARQLVRECQLEGEKIVRQGM